MANPLALIVSSSLERLQVIYDVTIVEGFAANCIASHRTAMDLVERYGSCYNVVIFDLQYTAAETEMFVRRMRQVNPGVLMLATSAHDQGFVSLDPGLTVSPMHAVSAALRRLHARLTGRKRAVTAF